MSDIICIVIKCRFYVKTSRNDGSTEILNESNEWMALNNGIQL